MAMTSRYVARQDDPVRQLAERIGAQIEALRTDRAKRDVVPLRGGKTGAR
jgi:hypothetical protein